jgi:hypothetical protein
MVVVLAAAAVSAVPLMQAQARSWIGEIEGTGPDHTVYATYDPGAVGRGNYTVLVTNTGSEPWGSFHFKIFDPTGTLDITNVSFLDSASGGEDPTSSQSGLRWEIDNDAVGATIDLHFCADPVVPGEAAFFSVFISNPDHVSFFGVAFYPGPVPPFGACCSPDGSCILTCEGDCVLPAIWHGDWTLCDPNPCAPPLVEAACCDLLGHCTLTIESECRPPSTWHPDWRSCDPISCPQPTPAEGTTWGAIKASYR